MAEVRLPLVGQVRLPLVDAVILARRFELLPVGVVVLDDGDVPVAERRLLLPRHLFVLLFLSPLAQRCLDVGLLRQLARLDVAAVGLGAPLDPFRIGVELLCDLRRIRRLRAIWPRTRESRMTAAQSGRPWAAADTGSASTLRISTTDHGHHNF
jgi:hypothetical protein